MSRSEEGRDTNGGSRPRTVLICHRGSELNRRFLGRWLASFSDLVGIIELDENRSRVIDRLRHERRRVGMLRLVDVLAMRCYYKLFLAAKDRERLRTRLAVLSEGLPEVSPQVEVLVTEGPNTPEAEAFVKRLAPDITIARCKRLITERVFSVPTHGTFVMHPGVCPEYRNAHGCFWALANDDLEKVGLTLLRIDKGVDTGPVYGYYYYDYDELQESHITIMERVVLENLDALRDKLLDVHVGIAEPIDTSGRQSDVWGQPWLTKYLGWKRAARRRHA